MTRQMLRGLLALLGAIVIVRMGFTGVVLGPEWHPRLSGATPTLDSEYRFLSVLAAAVGVLLIWVARAPESRAAVMHVLLGATFVGGLVRIGSGLAIGWPARPAAIATAIELAVPIVAWLLYSRVRARR